MLPGPPVKPALVMPSTVYWHAGLPSAACLAFIRPQHIYLDLDTVCGARDVRRLPAGSNAGSAVHGGWRRENRCWRNIARQASAARLATLTAGRSASASAVTPTAAAGMVPTKRCCSCCKRGVRRRVERRGAETGAWLRAEEARTALRRADASVCPASAAASCTASLVKTA